MLGHDLGQSEIENLGMATFGEENVRRLDVAMNNAFAVRSVQSLGNVERDRDNTVHLQRLRPDEVLKRGALEKLHRDERPAIVFADLVNGADVRVIQGRCSPGLKTKPLERARFLQAIHQEGT